LRYDLYTSRHTQWYYFQVRNAKPNVQYRFTICNLLKPDSLYNRGMRPLLYSESDARNSSSRSNSNSSSSSSSSSSSTRRRLGWRRVGENIAYYRNNMRSEDENGNQRTLYSLTWTCTFANENDTYYFAHCYPYTYTDLQVSIVYCNCI
jgi:cytosolic carboxypeptidase protein 2/3